MFKKVSLFCVLFSFLFTSLFASLNLNPKYLSHDEKSLFLDLKDGKLDKFSIIDFILIISGINSVGNDYKLYKNKFKNMGKDVSKYYKKMYKNLKNSERTDYEKASLLLKFLHDNYLRELDDNVSILDTVTLGNFNRLSSTILYVMLANGINLRVEGAFISNYIFAVLHTNDGDVYIDTTIQNGFNIDKNYIVENSLKNTENFIDIINTDKTITTLNIKELISLIYIKDFLSENSTFDLYSDKILSNYIKMMVINPKSIFFRTLLSNYLVAYAGNEFNENKIEKAIELIYDAKRVKKDNSAVYLKAIDIFNFKIDSFIQESNFDLANSNFQTCLQFFEDNDIQKNNYIDKLKKNCIKKILYYLNNRENIDSIKKLCDFALNSGVNQELDKKIEGFYQEVNKFDKENKERQILKDIILMFNNGNYEDVISKSEEIIKNNVITSSIILAELNNYRSSADKLILFSNLISKYDNKDFRHITYKEIKKIENLNTVTGNNDSINNKLIEIREELTKYRKNRNKKN